MSPSLDTTTTARISAAFERGTPVSALRIALFLAARGEAWRESDLAAAMNTTRSNLNKAMTHAREWKLVTFEERRVPGSTRPVLFFSLNPEAFA
jgi:hypothetical protein